MAKPKEIDRLKIKKNQAIGGIDRIKRFLSEHKDDPDTPKKNEQFLARKELLQETFQRIQDLQVEILCLDKFYNDDIDEIEADYFSVLVGINEILPKPNTGKVSDVSASNNSPSTSTSDNISTSKLPSIEIPSFDGKHLTNFKPFIDIFTAVVDKNKQLKDVEKLFYLRNYLKGEALSLINNLPLVNSSYIDALSILNNRYNNETMLVNSHIYSILDIPSMQKGTTSALRDFISSVKQQIGALKNLKQPIDSWDMILVCILSKKLDQFTNRAYQIDRDGSKLPTLKEFLTYLENRATALEVVGLPEVKNRERSNYTHLVVNSRTDNKCSYCSLVGHKIYNCKKFKGSCVNERISFVDKQKLCRLCLNNHNGKCRMSFKCSVCQKEHNSLLHLDKPSRPFHSDSAGNSLTGDRIVTLGSVDKKVDNIILPTVKVKIRAKDGSYVLARGLIDTGSQISLVTSSLVEKLNLKPFNNNLNIVGISENTTRIEKSINLNIQSCFYNYNTNVKCAVVETITSDLPQIDFDISQINIPENVQLSDSTFNKSDRIDILFGANVSFQILLSEKINLGKIILQNTLFGFIVSGSTSTNQFCNLVTLHATCNNLETLISHFWETEKVPEVFPEYSSEQEACETSFQNSVQINNKKYQVNLPLKQELNNLNLGDSFSVALKRFENLEKRFKTNPQLFNQYKTFIDEYLQLGHAKIVDLSSYDLNSGSVYFMAHHPVVREDKKTTKLRVVFDGSMKSKDKKCINDFLYNGPVMQNELFDILILFRTYKFVILTDVKQMYRMILIHPDHRQLQNILWRDTNNPLQCLQLQTVTYGLKSSSFLATRCLVELAHMEGQAFPLASRALLNNTYVDDILSGCDTIEETIQLKNELISLLKLRTFELHKWCSNNPKILSDIPLDKQNFDEVDVSKDNFVVKTLGISYDTKTDNFKLTSPKINIHECLTKRQVLSFISKFYDPLGLVGPILVAAKVIMQKLWLCKLNWDEILPNDLLQTWQNFLISLMNMPVLHISRNLMFTGAESIELIGFCDSSLTAYGAALYSRTIFCDNINVNLICSKSRITPANKNLTIPRLELNSALLLSSLAKKVSNSLGINNVFLYSDSTIALSWVKSEPIKLNPYVANRVIKIQNLTHEFKWSYINSKENPADCLSRGLDPQEIESNNLWFHGPKALSTKDYSHDESSFPFPNPLPEEKVIVNLLQNKPECFQKFSSITKFQRVIAYVLRFVNNSKNKENKLIGNLSLFELENSMKVIIKCEQRFHFSEEIKCLSSNSTIKSNLNSLSPFLDGEGILRVGGRLHNSNIPYNQKHPIILPKNNHLTNLLIQREHMKLLHAGPRQVLSSLNLNFWLINGNREVKKVIHKCVICFKFKAKCSEQLMGSLPEKRVCSARIFQNVGVDFCGPFYIKQSRLRKSITSKSYIALFICFSVKAIHMELLSDMTTDNFLAAFKRFICRRGKPSNVFCDNGSTFKGANNQLNKIYEQKHKLENFCLDEKIKFNFIPSYSPVFGGLWEAGVKSAKFHIKRIMGNSELTYEEFNTLIIQVEGILNSRPLTPMSNDPSDLDYLTPGHFLIGASITSFPENDLTGIPQNRLKFWKLCVQMKQHFWQRWYKDYLAQLQSRPKWRKETPNLVEGLLVLLKEDNVPSFQWPMARITKVIPGKDSKVRVLEVKTKNGTYLRSITKVAVLPIY